MARRLFHTLVLSTVLLTSVNAQDSGESGCFWPNSLPTNATDSIPCTSANSARHLGTSNSLNACCPPDWMCLSNGLCQNPSASQGDQPSVGEGQFGRYGCTDSSFNGCPRGCTGEASRSGAEAVLQCQQDIFCCDRNRVSGNCCLGQISNNPPYFQLNDQASLLALTAATSGATPTAPITNTGGGGPTTSSVPETSSTPITSSSSSSSTPTPTPTPTTSLSTDSAGSVMTVFVTPSAEPSANAGSGSSNTGAIAGGVVGGVVGAALLIGGLVFFLWRRRRVVPVRRDDEDVDHDADAAAAAKLNEDAGSEEADGPVEADSREKAEIDGFPIHQQKKYGELGASIEHGGGSMPIIELPTTEK